MKTKTYVITGATSGIGNALLKELASDNIVFASYRNDELKSELEAISTNVYPFYLDYSKPETIKLAADYLVSKCTKIDTLVNVAGCVVAGPIENIEISEIRRQFDVNVFGHLEFSKALLENLSDGKIINISSMASYGVFPYISPYCASKRCLDMFFNSLMLENKKNIRVISIKPGVIATPLWDKSIVENSKYFNNCSDYYNEMRFLVANAQKNAQKGAEVSKVVETILKADRASNPKTTYTVGKDAFFARILAKLPQSVQNNVVKLGLKLRIK